MKRALLIILGIVVILGGGAAAYYFYALYTPDIAVGPVTPGIDLPVAGSTTPPTSGESTPPPTNPDTPKPEKVASRLVKIDKGPVVLGAVVFQVASTTSNPKPDTAVNYIARESGNVYQYLVRAGSLTRISNKTVPGIQETKWAPDGSLAFVRYLSGEDRKTINTYALPSNGTNGYFLAQNLQDLSVSASSVLMLASGTNGSVASVSRLDGSNEKQVFSTPLTALRVAPAGKSQYLAFTKPAATIPGYVFFINSTGNFERIAGPLSGLVALPSPSGKWALVSYTNAGTLKMTLINTETHEATVLPVGTVADKCVWTTKEDLIYCGIPMSPASAYSYPDDWYQGAVSFSDRIWKINIAGRFAELVLDVPKEIEDEVDAVGLALDPLAQVLVFRNKIDGALWSYEL
jgi:hypothetical protein